MSTDADRIARLERRFDALEERLNDVLSALASVWGNLSADGKEVVGRVAKAANARPTPKETPPVR
jgi:hypothetical protein